MTAPARLAPVAPRGARALCRALTLFPLALVVISTIAANAVPVAVTSVSCSATSSGDDSKVFGPLPVGLFTACDRASIGRQASSDVQTDLGPGLPRAGAVIASANASSSSFLQAASASSGGTVSYYFEVVEEIPPPFAPVTFPIYFEARGEGTLSGGSDPDTFGSATASFTVQAGLPEAGISFGLRNVDSSETSFDSFDDNTVVDLAPNSSSNPFYSVELFAGCQADASGFSSSCQAVVDPLVRFDQGTFDAVHGSNSFDLATYYRLDFSENLPVPEPRALSLLGIALLGAAGLCRGREG